MNSSKYIPETNSFLFTGKTYSGFNNVLDIKNKVQALIEAKANERIEDTVPEPEIGTAELYETFIDRGLKDSKPFENNYLNNLISARIKDEVAIELRSGKRSRRLQNTPQLEPYNFHRLF
jgi:hypothetical protein